MAQAVSPGAAALGPSIAAPPAQPRREVRTREARLDDYPGIAALQARNDLQPRPYSAWARMWTENPAYLERGSQFPLGWVLEDQAGSIRGYIGNLPLAYWFRGRITRAATPYSWVVDPEYRVHSVALQHRFQRQRDVDLFVCTTPNAIAEKVLRAFEFSKVGIGEWDVAGFWITGYCGFARSALRAASVPGAAALAYPVSAALFLGDAVASWPRRRNSGAQLEVLNGFDSRFDVFWEELKSQNQNSLLAVRNRETLEWHFRSALERKDLWILTAMRGAGLVAYAIFDRQDHPALGLNRIRFADFQALRGHEELLRSAVAWMLQKCRRERIHVAENVGCWLNRFNIPGSAPRHRRRLKSWLFYYKARDPELFRQLQDPTVWAPSSFDGDASL